MILPPGLLPNRTVTIITDIADRLGAKTTVQNTVVVNNIIVDPNDLSSVLNTVISDMLTNALAEGSSVEAVQVLHFLY